MKHFAFASIQVTTLETCPACQEPGVRVEQGYAAEIDGPIFYNLPMRYWHCPVCGPSMVHYIEIEFVVWDKDAQLFIETCHPYGEGEIERTPDPARAGLFRGAAWLNFWQNQGYEIKQVTGVSQWPTI